MSTEIIFGSPGTGKTTHLLNIVDKELSAGVEPERIAFVSFTRKAANEARSRASEKFKFNSDRLPWFRTLHSMAYATLGLGKTSMMTRDHYKKMYKEIRLGVADKVLAVGSDIDEEVDTPLVATGGVCDTIYSFARQTLCPVPETWRSMYIDVAAGKVTEQQFKRFVSGLEEYKYENALLDYTDLLEMYIKEGCSCPVDVAIIDEAQDLTPLQWKMADAAFRNAKRVYIAGDDDQAIYAWAGANANRLLTGEGARTVLGRSYRLPKVIHQRACGIVERIRVREPKNWSDNGEEGFVGNFSMGHPEDMSEGTWLLLARDGFLLQKYVDLCKSRGHVYLKHGKLSVDPAHYRAIMLWERLRKGEHIKKSEAIKVYSSMGANIGFRWGEKGRLDADPEALVNIEDLQQGYGLLTTAPWFDALTAIKKSDIAYYRNVLSRGEKLTATPRICISTIHGVKGGEADNVVIVADTSTTSYKHALKNPCNEHRVFYVGVTRAKKRLLLVPPETPAHYRI